MDNGRFSFFCSFKNCVQNMPSDEEQYQIGAAPVLFFRIISRREINLYLSQAGHTLINGW